MGKDEVVEELDQELAGGVLLVGRESFDGDEDGGSDDGEDEESMDVRCGEMDLDGGCIGQGQVGRLVRGRGWKIWHSYGGGLECW